MGLFDNSLFLSSSLPSVSFNTPSLTTPSLRTSSLITPSFNLALTFPSLNTGTINFGNTSTVNTSTANTGGSTGTTANTGENTDGSDTDGSDTDGSNTGGSDTGGSDTGGNESNELKLKLNKIGSGLGMAADISNSLLSGIAGPKSALSGPNGNLTQSIDSAYDSAANTMMLVNPMIGGIMKAAGFAGNLVNSVGGGTDGMTKTDAILDSAPMTLMTMGLNGFLGSKTDTFTKDSEAFDQVGGSYGGTGDIVEDALSKAGKKYGLLSGGARDEANALIRKAKALQSIMSDIASSSKDSFAIQSSMTAINNTNRANKLQGGYNQAAIRVGKQGLKVKKIVSAYYMKKLQDGGTTELSPYLIFLNSLPKNLSNYDPNYRMKDFWEFNGRPKNFKEGIDKGMFTLKYDGWHAGSVALNPETGDYEFMKSSSHPSIIDELNWYNSDDGKLFRDEYELIKTEPFYRYSKRKVTTDDLPEEVMFLEQGDDIPSIKSVSPGYNIKFKFGGSFNVIPEGALHARKHNMDIEGITKKGIPVVAQTEDGEIEQQAEIERNEIIYRLEVTKKLEELLKKYYSDNYTKKEKDEFAIEAGKLLVHETLHNTLDNTGLLNEN